MAALRTTIASRRASTARARSPIYVLSLKGRTNDSLRNLAGVRGAVGPAARGHRTVGVLAERMTRPQTSEGVLLMDRSPPREADGPPAPHLGPFCIPSQLVHVP
jgi:hypothetical protein